MNLGGIHQGAQATVPEEVLGDPLLTQLSKKVTANPWGVCAVGIDVGAVASPRQIDKATIEALQALHIGSHFGSHEEIASALLKCLAQHTNKTTPMDLVFFDLNQLDETPFQLSVGIDSSKTLSELTQHLKGRFPNIQAPITVAPEPKEASLLNLVNGFIEKLRAIFQSL